jgi:putative addiction module component (TIGR02574 family)
VKSISSDILATSTSASWGSEIDVSKVEYLVQGRAMSAASKKLEDDALKLPARSRARLAERLITSLEETAEPQAEREWLLEIERRSVELKSSKVKGVTAGKVFKKAGAALR